MTALAGLWRFDGQPGEIEDCRHMLRAQAAYGSDNVRDWHDGGVALGRSLAALLPEDQYDRQPIIGGGGRFRLVADLRIDNRAELTEALGLPAERTRGMADADFLMAAFERWDLDCLDHVVGDFAFALWDQAARRLVLARDPLGQRPLHYHRGPGFFAFASMPKGLHALPEIPYAADEDRVTEFLALMPENGPRSFFAGVSRLEPGHVQVTTPDGDRARSYWQPQRGPLRLRDRAAYVDTARALFDRVVGDRLRGAGVVGSHLSAGFDSSGVTATAARLLQPAGGRVVAFTSVPPAQYDSAGFGKQLIDEGPLAAGVAALYPNIEHVRVPPSDRSPIDDLNLAFLMFERPIINPCNMDWQQEINLAARGRGLRVVLTGQFGNMGLTYAGSERLAELVGAGRWGAWARMTSGMLRHRVRLPHILSHSFGPWCPAALWLLLHRLRYDVDHGLDAYTALNPNVIGQLDLAGRARAVGLDPLYRPWKNGFDMRLWVLRRVDLGNFNKGALGAWGIDMRDPTADRRWLEFCLSLPSELFVEGGKPRAFARAVLADRLPRAVLDERRKGRQAVFWHERVTKFRSEIEDELGRLGRCGPAGQALDLERLNRLATAWPKAGWAEPVTIRDYRAVMLRGVAAGHFLRRATGSN